MHRDILKMYKAGDKNATYNVATYTFWRHLARDG
jgi:hypothetical protein